MEKFQSLADYLGVTPPLPGETSELLDERVQFDDPKTFAMAVLNSMDFRRYLINAFTFGNVPAGIVLRIMELAWGKPVERVEHTGKDGAPIESITEVRRVVVHVASRDEFGNEKEEPPVTTH